MHQITQELGDIVPKHLTLIFGHTHKPFTGTLRKSDKLSLPVTLYNTGGWVVDTEETKPVHGAAIVLVDDTLECASLRMYNEPELRHGTPSPVKVIAHGECCTALRDELTKHLRHKDELWSTFSRVMTEAIEHRRQAIARRLRRVGVCSTHDLRDRHR